MTDGRRRPGDVSARDLAGRYAGVVLDLDGVCYLGGVAIPGADRGIARLREAGLPVRFVTNNSTRTPGAVAELLRGLGIPAAPEEVIGSAVAAAAMLAPGTRCLVIGMEGLLAALAERGCAVVDDPRQAEAVVVGMDTSLTWERLCAATTALAEGARFVGTNGDVSFPTADGLWPGNGAVLAALHAATGRAPEVAGKPQAPLLEQAAASLPDGRLLMVGDRLDTDIVGAQHLGWDTVLVLSGICGADEAARADPAPTHVIDSLAAIQP